MYELKYYLNLNQTVEDFGPNFPLLMILIFSIKIYNLFFASNLCGFLRDLTNSGLIREWLFVHILRNYF